MGMPVSREVSVYRWVSWLHMAWMRARRRGGSSATRSRTACAVSASRTVRSGPAAGSVRVSARPSTRAARLLWRMIARDFRVGVVRVWVRGSGARVAKDDAGQWRLGGPEFSG